MKTYIDTNTGKVWEFEDDGSQDHLITADMELYTIPEPTQAELEAEAIASKWIDLNKYLSTLTVQREATDTDPIGFKFSADPQSIANISLEIDTMLDTDTRVWYEDWGNATVTKQELQEAKILASEAKQIKLTELFGA